MDYTVKQINKYIKDSGALKSLIHTVSFEGFE